MSNKKKSAFGGKKSLLILIAIVLLLMVPKVVRAELDQKKTFKQDHRDLLVQRKELKEDFKNKMKAWRAEFENMKGRHVRLVNEELTAKNGITLSVTAKDGKTYSIVTDEKTVLKRRFWGKATLDEMNIGDKLNISGFFTDDAKSTIAANWIRDLSIQKRAGVFWGKITSLDSGNNSFVMDTGKRGTQSVILSSMTEIINRKLGKITFTDLKVGDQVKVRGEWDNTLNKISDVVSVKDNSR